jgi:hypothetical protein
MLRGGHWPNPEPRRCSTTPRPDYLDLDGGSSDVEEQLIEGD